MDSLFDYDYSLDVGDKFYLKDIIKEDTYERMFKRKSISFLNKGQCGNGGTTGFIEYALDHNKGCLILVPNRSIVMSKEVEYKDNMEVCCVYGGCESFDRDTRIVIATYDQFPRLLKDLQSHGYTLTDDIWESKFWAGRTIIIDEYQKLVDDSGFRDICHKITELIQNTDSGVVLMSATPHQGYIDFTRDLVEDKDIITYNIDYDPEAYNKCIQVYDVKKKDLKSILKKVKDCPKNNHTCVFYNNVNGIKELLDHIGDDECEVLCSETNKDELGKYYSKTFNDKKKLHFLTSAFFTGQDINTYVKQCIIIGSREFESMCIGERDIKQIIGRFREGVDGVHIFYLNRKTQMDKYQAVKNSYDKNSKYLKVMGDKWNTTPETIELKQDTIRLEDTLDRFDYWSKKQKLIKRLQDYGYVVKDKKVEEFDNIGRRKKLSFDAAKRMIAAGETVTYDDNKYFHQIQEYMQEKGVEDMLNASRATITDWYKIRKSVGISDLDLLSPEEKFQILGLENFGKYRGSYLMSCLQYLGVSCEYDQLSAKMKETLDCYVTLWEKDKKGKTPGNSFIVFREEGKIPPKMGMCYYIEREKNIPKTGGIFPLTDDVLHKLSYQTCIKHKCCKGKTISLNEAPFKYSTLKGIPLYDWVNEDKEHRLSSEVKDSSDWLDIKKFHQTKISEMYKETDEEYDHKKTSMEYVDCLILDIDSSLSFAEFQERYKDYLWVSYPTINNIPDDWVRFRVIVPLKGKLRLCGEYNLMTLKMLRSMFCYYEDQEHQLTSYINIEDWLKRRGNNGELYDIPQEVVDDIMLNIKNSKELEMMKFDKNRTDKNLKGFHRSAKTLEWAQDYFRKSFELGDGERYKRLFVIKNNLDDIGRDQFQAWLQSEYSSKYVSKWKCHKVV